MPPQCNALMFDESLGLKEFCAFACSWGIRNVGRKPSNKPKKEMKKMKSSIKNPKPICLVMEKEHVDFIKNQALQRSILEGAYIEPNELIREALQKAFPAPKNFDMFGKRI